MKAFVTALFLLLAFAMHADAKVVALSLDASARWAEHIVDATIEGFTDEGYAKLKIQAVYKGENPPLVAKFVRSCTRDTAKSCLAAGTRAIFFLTQNGGLITGTCALRQAADGTQECEEYKPATREKAWISIADFKKRVTAAGNANR